MSVGLTPSNAVELNAQLGQLLRRFIETQESVSHWSDWLATVDLKTPPYSFDTAEEGLIKSAVGDLNTALTAIDMTFITRLVGPF